MPSSHDIEIYAAEPRLRYVHFLEAVAKSEIIWGMWAGDSWVVRADPEGRVLFLLWPSDDFAKRTLTDFAAEMPPDSVPEAIPLRKRIDAYTLDLIDNKDWPCVFPGRDFTGVIVAPADLKRDLEQAYRAARGKDVDRTQ
jgi:hypothetical protein